MTYLQRLPDNVLLLIRDALVSDLASHVALSRTCHKLSVLYNDDIVWRRACFLAGFGRPIRRNQGEGPSWRSVALLLVSHPRNCAIRSCKGAYAWFAGHRRLDTLHGPLDLSQEMEDVHVVPHPLYQYLHFTDETASDLDPLAILFTQLPTFPDCVLSHYGPLCLHVNASCVFVTSPPVTTLTIQYNVDNDEASTLTVCNEHGITVLDLNRALSDLMVGSATDASVAVEHYRSIMQGSNLDPKMASYPSFQKGFLDDHEYPYLSDLISSMDTLTTLQPHTGRIDPDSNDIRHPGLVRDIIA